MVSIIGKQILFLKEFAEGLKVCGVLQAVKENEEVAKNVLVKGKEAHHVDANYHFSLLCPDYSDDGTSETPLWITFKISSWHWKIITYLDTKRKLHGMMPTLPIC